MAELRQQFVLSAMAVVVPLYSDCQAFRHATSSVDSSTDQLSVDERFSTFTVMEENVVALNRMLKL
jgi:hypothetical protein